MFRIRKTCLEMLADRGYLITEVLAAPPPLPQGLHLDGAGSLPAHKPLRLPAALVGARRRSVTPRGISSPTSTGQTSGGRT